MNKENHEIRRYETERNAKSRIKAMQELKTAELKELEAWEENKTESPLGFRLLEIWGYVA